jgi:hydroxyquinol 1,2-dioxygenase
MGGDICRQKDAGTPTFVSGRIRSIDGTPIQGAVLDIWQVPANGMYAVDYDFVLIPGDTQDEVRFSAGRA